MGQADQRESSRLPSSVTRRRVLVFLASLGVGAAAGPARAIASCRYKLSERLSLKGRLIIDSHCHVFNLADLPVEQFLRQVQFRERGSPFLGQVIRFVKKLQRRSMGYRAEVKVIDRRGGPTTVASTRTRGFQAEDPAAERAVELALAETLGTKKDESTKFRGFTAGKPDGDADEKFKSFLERKYGLTRGPDGTLTKKTTRGWKSDSFSDPEEDDASRTLDWGKLLTRSRMRISDNMIRTFSPSRGHASVNLYTPALVDFEQWLDERTPTSIPQQIDLMERIIVAQRGMLHGFVSYCPWRQIDEEARGRKKTALDRVEDAILNRGFIGVKLYPPMGFRPIGNGSLKTKDFPAHLAGKPYARGFGRALDRAMLRLYDLCIEHDFCIMVHTAPTQHAGAGYEQRAHPKYWRRILSMPKYANLRVNLAHFGGFELAEDGKINFASPKSWHHHVGKALTEHKNVYADLSHFDALLTDGCDDLRTNMIAFLRTFPGVERKVMYGSDWSFISREKFHGRYLETMASWLIRKVVGKKTTYDIMGNNAANFLGLRKGDANRRRLETFYKDYDIPKPDWMEMV